LINANQNYEHTAHKQPCFCDVTLLVGSGSGSLFCIGSDHEVIEELTNPSGSWAKKRIKRLFN